MSAADYAACDFWNSAGAHPYLQQRMNQMQQYYYRDPSTFEGHHIQEGQADYNFNGYNYPDVKSEQQPSDVSTSTTTDFRYDGFPVMNTCRQQSVTKNDSSRLRALLTEQKKQQDCNYYNQEERNETDYNKIDLLLSPSSERSSETDRESETTKTALEQPAAQFYPWMKTHHGKSNICTKKLFFMQ